MNTEEYYQEYLQMPLKAVLRAYRAIEKRMEDSGDEVNELPEIDELLEREMASLYAIADMISKEDAEMTKIQEIQKLQALLDYRTEVENKAIELISACRFNEACQLLSTLDSTDDIAFAEPLT